MNKCIWNTPGTLAEKFWRDGRGDFPIYDMHGHMGAHYAICFKRCEAPEMVAHVKRIGVNGWYFPTMKPCGEISATLRSAIFAGSFPIRSGCMPGSSPSGRTG